MMVNDAKLLDTVLQSARQNKEIIESVPFGKEWLDYLERLSTDPFFSRTHHVENAGAIKESIDWMYEHLQTFKSNDPKTTGRNEDPQTHDTIVSYLDRQLSRMSSAETVSRSDLYNAGVLFSRVAEYMVGERNPAPYYPDYSPEQLIRRISKTEEELNQQYGMTSLPIPSPRSLSLEAFISMEGIGVVPVGLTVEPQLVDSVSLGPQRFLEHDLDHYRTRMSHGNERLPLTVLMSKRGPIDIALFADRGSAINFLLLVKSRIETLPTRRKQVLAQAVLFYMIHERGDYYGISDFNAKRIKVIAKDLLYSENRDRMSIHDFDALKRRLQNRGDLGQAFRNSPSHEEIREIVIWLRDI